MMRANRLRVVVIVSIYHTVVDVHRVRGDTVVTLTQLTW